MSGRATHAGSPFREPLRVAVVAACPFPWPRGTPIRIQRLAEGLAECGHEVHVFTYHLGEPLPDPPFRVHRIHDVPEYRRTEPGPHPRKLFQIDPLLPPLLRSRHRDVGFHLVHAHHYEGLLVAASAGLGVPLVYDAHTLLQGELPDYPLPIPVRLTRRGGALLDRWLPRLATRVIAVSESIRHCLVDLGAVSRRRVDIVPNGVECERFPNAPPGSVDGEEIIFTGNLAPYQGVDLLIRAFANLRRHRPSARLRIVTDSSPARYAAMAEGLGVEKEVEFHHAPFSQHPELLASASVAVSPRTRCDGVPQKLLNYMAAGTPIVSFDGSAAFLEDGRTALRVPDGDVDAMARAIERLLDDRALARRIGEEARLTARRDHSWSAAARRVEEVYNRTLGSGRAT